MPSVEEFSVNKSTVAISYLTQIFQYGTSLFVLPVLLSYLDDKTLGVWYLFLSVSSLTYLLDFGFSGALSRNISFVFRGAKEIIKEGSPQMREDGTIDYYLLRSLLDTSKKTYLKIAIAIFVLLTTVGTVYILHATEEVEMDNKILIWLFFSFSTAFNYYYGYVNVFTRGRGMVSLSNNIIIVTKLTYVVFVFLLIFLDCGLWALVVANFMSAAVARLMGYRYFFDKNLKHELKQTEDKKSENLFPIIWYNAKRFGLASFTTFAFSQANVLLAGAFLSMSDVAKLGLALQLISVIVVGARVPFNTYYPKICALWVDDNKKEIKRIFFKCQFIGYLIWIVGFGVLIFGGNIVLELIHSKTSLPAAGVIVCYALFNLMELTHGNCSMLISSRNSVPFLMGAITACIGSLSLMFIFLHLGMGLYSFPIAMCLSNLPYNSWKWVYEAYKLMK